MKLLMVLLAVMNWTVTSKTSVSGDGLWPYDIEVSYSCTYQKGDVRQGDQAVLTLTHLEGIAIEQVDVYLRSNQSGGAGMFTVAVDGQTVATKSGTFEEWFRAYDNTDYHALTLLSQTQNNVNTLVVTLDGTANSLHIEKYVITWANAPARNVTLMNGASTYTVVSEASGGQGIVLPALPDTAEWQFIGWSETEFYQISTMPETLYPAQQRFYPKADCTLWAVYSYGNPAVDEPVTTLQSGVYLYVNDQSNYALAGVPSDGIMWPATFDGTDENQYYQMDFTASLDTVYLTHAKTGTPIGYSGTKLTATKSPWRVYHQGEETVLYMTSGGKNYVLWLNVYNSGDVYTGLLQANPGNSPLVLRLPSTTDEPLFTCHPESGMGFVDAKAGVQGTKTIRNGRLFIERDGQMFNVLGVRVR